MTRRPFSSFVSVNSSLGRVTAGLASSAPAGEACSPQGAAKKPRLAAMPAIRAVAAFCFTFICFLHECARYVYEFRKKRAVFCTFRWAGATGSTRPFVNSCANMVRGVGGRAEMRRAVVLTSRKRGTYTRWTPKLHGQIQRKRDHCGNYRCERRGLRAGSLKQYRWFGRRGSCCIGGE